MTVNDTPGYRHLSLEFAITHVGKQNLTTFRFEVFSGGPITITIIAHTIPRHKFTNNN